jgi:hypothetical protein
LRQTVEKLRDRLAIDAEREANCQHDDGNSRSDRDPNKTPSRRRCWRLCWPQTSQSAGIAKGEVLRQISFAHR